MIGIYKITSPKKRTYIGQSVNIKKRFKEYKSMSCKYQPRLYNSFSKYGVLNHIFEIITECEINELNKLERYYQDVYNSIDIKYGLNCRLTSYCDRSGKFSEYSKQKLKNSHKGKILSEHHKQRIKEGLANLYKSGYKSPNLGKKHSQEVKDKLAKIRTGTKRGEETRKKISESKKKLMQSEGYVNKNIGKKRTPDQIKKMSEVAKGRKFSKEHIAKLSKINSNRPKEWNKKISDSAKRRVASLETRMKISKAVTIRNSKLVIDLENGFFYDSIKDCYKYNRQYFNITESHFAAKLKINKCSKFMLAMSESDCLEFERSLEIEEKIN
jgi:group I intron endonuclease